jgi:L,D-transpeptidase YbiS
MRIRISLPQQTLELHDELGMLLRRYRVSTAKNGPGEQNGSFCTPRGRHIVRAKVGAGATANTVFVRRRPTGETWTPQLAEQFPGRDWILTRILWLSGKEPGAQPARRGRHHAPLHLSAWVARYGGDGHPRFDRLRAHA